MIRSMLRGACAISIFTFVACAQEKDAKAPDEKPAIAWEGDFDQALQKAKLITYTRGELSILDRAGLERAACVCYQVDLDSYSKAMAGAA